LENEKYKLDEKIKSVFCKKNNYEKKIEEGYKMLSIQKDSCDYDPYMLGMYNGMEFMLSLIDSREVNYMSVPKVWSRKLKLSFPDNELEDNSLCRNFRDVFSIDDMIKEFYKDGKTGEPLEFDEVLIVIASLKELLDGFEKDLASVRKTKKCSGYASWDNSEEDIKALSEEIYALKRVLL